VGFSEGDLTVGFPVVCPGADRAAAGGGFLRGWSDGGFLRPPL